MPLHSGRGYWAAAAQRQKRAQRPIRLDNQGRKPWGAVKEQWTRIRPRVLVQRGALIGAVRGSYPQTPHFEFMALPV